MYRIYCGWASYVENAFQTTPRIVLIGQLPKPAHIQTFVVKCAVKAFDMGVRYRLAGLDVKPPEASNRRPNSENAAK